MSQQERLFDEAVRRIRTGHERFLDVVGSMESDCRAAGLDSSVVCSQARGYLEKTQAAALEAAIVCFRRGEDWRVVLDKFMKAGFSPYNSEVCAARAQAKAEELGPLQDEETEDAPSAGA
jgi:hypothetical protein